MEFPDADATVREVKTWKATGRLPRRLVGKRKRLAPRVAENRAPIVIVIPRRPRPEIGPERIAQLLAKTCPIGKRGPRKKVSA